MKLWIAIRLTQKKNGKNNYMKMVQKKTLLVIPNKSYEHFSEVMVNVNDL